MLKILHTADWHVGRSFGQFEPDVSRKLARDRVSVIERIMGLAQQFDVDAVLCAGDLFDTQDPGEPWWQAVAEVFVKAKSWGKPVVLLPGNHDPLTLDSVYQSNHPFRRALPEWIHVVDKDDFQLELNESAVVYAAPCRSKAGDRDLALSLPARAQNDTRIRIGLVHGSTFDIEGYATNFPVSKESASRQGLDYLAIGDAHGFRTVSGVLEPPIVYPSTPEPTNFRETEAGYVALVTFKRTGTTPHVRRERVARWNWREVVVRTLDELRSLAAEDLVSTVLKLSLDLSATIAEAEEVDVVLKSLRGTDAISARVGAIVCDRSRLRFSGTATDPLDSNLPTAVLETAKSFEALVANSNGDSSKAQRALTVLRRLLREVV